MSLIPMEYYGGGGGYKEVHTAAGSSGGTARTYADMLSELSPYYNALTNKALSIIVRGTFTVGSVYYYYGNNCYIGFQKTSENKLFSRVIDMSAQKVYDANGSFSFIEMINGGGTGLVLYELTTD